jgi:hypothetical protein
MRASRAARGAALLEAVLVVSILMLSLVGTVYVARIYQTTLRALAVSRAAAIGHSNESCRGDDAASWFSREEAALLQAATGDESGTQDSGAARVNDQAAQRALSRATQSGAFGSPRVMSIATGGDVFGPLLDASRPGGIFYTAVKANDHVLCGEREHMRGSLGVLGFARDFFKF